MAAQEDKNKTDNLMWIFAGIFLVIFGIWYFKGEQIGYWYLKLKLFELNVLSLFLPFNSIKESIDLVETHHVYELTMMEIIMVGSEVGKYITLPFLIYYANWGYKKWKSNPSRFLKRELNMKTLARSESGLWPYIKPVLGLDLLKADYIKGEWAMSMKPLEYVQKYKLLKRDNDLSSLDKMKTEKCFANQLSKMWEGPDKLKTHMKALFGIFAAFSTGESGKKEAMKAINEIAISAEGGKKPNFSAGIELFNKYKKHEDVLKVVNRHAYAYTALASLLEHARKQGVLPTSFLIWLKPLDRSMFYMLNCVGRQVAFVEVAGIFSHWIAEKTAKHAIEKPYVVKAVEGLDKAMQEIKLKVED